MKKTWIGLITGLFAVSALIGCGAREEGDITVTTPPPTTTTSADDAPKETPTAVPIDGRPGDKIQPGTADDMPEKKPDGEAAAKVDEHAGHNHAPGEGH